MKMFLRTVWPIDKHREIVIDRFPFVIGRRCDTDLTLPLAFVSRRHCQFIRMSDDVLVQDLESYNGTFVNGMRATSPLPVRHGDELTIGPCSFEIQVVHDTAETPALLSALGTAEMLAAQQRGANGESTVKGNSGSFPRPGSNGSKH
jgi:pSer/pThr/pTyr-binding forkhead associated (FHA) protein